MAKEFWKDPSGNICSVDASKWDAKEVKLRGEQGWAKATPADLAASKAAADAAAGKPATPAAAPAKK